MRSHLFFPFNQQSLKDSADNSILPVLHCFNHKIIPGTFILPQQSYFLYHLSFLLLNKHLKTPPYRNTFPIYPFSLEQNLLVFRQQQS
jgi:hypothetical protein